MAGVAIPLKSSLTAAPARANNADPRKEWL